jgi:hypothetical protein
MPNSAHIKCLPSGELHSPEDCPCVKKLVAESEALDFPTTTISVALEAQQVADLYRHADVSGIDRDNLIRLAVYEFIERKKARPRFTSQTE